MVSSYETTQRQSTTSPAPPISQTDESKNTTRKFRPTFSYSCPFDIPTTPESAAVRIVKNLVKFSLFYAIFIWTVLFIVLIPKRKVSIAYLVGMTEVSLMYFLLPRAVPEAVVIDRFIDRRIVSLFLFVVTIIMMVLTEAGIHLFVTLAATFPVVMVHAMLSKREDVFVSGEGREMVSLVDGKDEVALPETLV